MGCAGFSSIEALPPRVELDDAVSLGVLHRIGEDGCPGRLAAARCEHLLEALAVEDIVAQDQRHRFAADEIRADQEGLRQPVGLRLHGISDRDPELAAVPQQALEPADVVGRRDQEHLADAGQHQRRQRVIDHRLVVDRQELLARRG